MAPDFSLQDVAGRDIATRSHRLSEQRGRVVILNFWSAECPWAERADLELSAYLADWGEQVCWWSIASNASESREMIAEAAGTRALPVVLLDIQQQVADLYGAQATPHVFVIDSQGRLRYQGAFDDVTFRQRVPSRFFLREAVDALLAGRLPETTQTSTYGCAIVRDYSEFFRDN